MKKSLTILYKSALFLLIVLTISCNKDDIGNGKNIDFILEANRGFDDTIAIFCTNQFGDLLFDTVAQKIDKVIKFKVSKTDIINLNYATLFNKNVSVTTYNDIKNGYNLNHEYSCEGLLDQNVSIGGTYEINIHGISEYQKFLYPRSFPPQIDTDKSKNSVIITGKHYTTSDIILTILPINSNEYLSYYVKNEDKEISNNNHYIFNIDYNDFKPSIKYEVTLDFPYRWYLNARAISEENKQVEITEADLSMAPSEETDKLIFYSTDFKIKQLRISANLNFTPIDYAFQKYYTQFPTHLSLYNPQINLSEINPKEYNINVSSPYDLATINYTGATNLYWKVYEKYSENSTTKNPVLPPKIIKVLNFNGDNNFNQFHIKLSKMRSDFNSQYNKSSSAVELFCGEKESKTVTQKY